MIWNMEKKIEKFKSRWMRNRPIARRFRFRALLFAAGVSALAGGMLTACGEEGARVIFTTGLGEDEVFRIDSVSATLPELMVYLTTTQNQYESVYGEEVWSVSLDGVTLEENVKDTVLAKIAQIKAMYLLAQEKGVALDEEETEKAKKAAMEYFSSLGEREKELMGVDEDIILQLYTEYALADKVYGYIIQDVNPEISDDEARIITVQHILLHTYTVDDAGERVSYTEEQKKSVYEQMCAIREQAVSGEQDFVDLASKYSEDSMITYSFGKGEMNPAFEDAAFRLETEEVSQIVETDAGYHLIKCINTFDREQTDLNKLEIVEERRREVFGEEYNAFVDTLVCQLNTKLWDGVSLIHDEAVTNAGFFEIYNKYFT